MLGLQQNNLFRKPLKDANFLSVQLYVYIYVYVICLHAGGGRCAKTVQNSYGLYDAKNKQRGSCILMTKRVTRTNLYDTAENSYCYCCCETAVALLIVKQLLFFLLDEYFRPNKRHILSRHLGIMILQVKPSKAIFEKLTFVNISEYSINLFTKLDLSN